jgi:choline dehydrogenase-like flavoprotein
MLLPGGWLRGDKEDYDLWARLVDNPRWSYNGLLPYFARSKLIMTAGGSTYSRL